MLRRCWAILAILGLLLFLTAGVVVAAPSLTIEPSRGQVGTSFVANLAGFTPGESIGFRLTAETTPSRTLDVPTVTIRADGGYRLDITSLLLPAGGYTLVALRQGAVVASAGFTVTAPPPPTPRPSTPTRAVPVPTATRVPVIPTAVPPTVPPTGNGGYLPGLPNTGGGPPPSFPARAASVGALALLALCLIGGRLLQRVARRREAGK
ncbi:MAG: hypothetical protein U0232_22160 [Thermomicrobiales bacterium]